MDILNKLPQEIENKVFYMVAEHPCARIIKNHINEVFLTHYCYDFYKCFFNCRKYFGMKKDSFLPKNYDIDDMARFLSFAVMCDDYIIYERRIQYIKKERPMNERHYKRVMEEYEECSKFNDIKEFQKHVYELEGYRNIFMIIKEDYEDFKGVFFPMSSYWKQKFNLKPKYRGRVYDSDFDDD